jgi:hypothetical protein
MTGDGPCGDLEFVVHGGNVYIILFIALPDVKPFSIVFVDDVVHIRTSGEILIVFVAGFVCFGVGDTMDDYFFAGVTGPDFDRVFAWGFVGWYEGGFTLFEAWDVGCDGGIAYDRVHGDNNGGSNL